MLTRSPQFKIIGFILIGVAIIGFVTVSLLDMLIPRYVLVDAPPAFFYAIGGSSTLTEIEEAISNDPALIHEPLFEGFYSIHIACKSNRLDVVALLLDHGADPNQRGGFYQATPLVSAIESQNGDVIALLLDRGADSSLSMADGTSILDYAKEVGTKEAVELIDSRRAK